MKSWLLAIGIVVGTILAFVGIVWLLCIVWSPITFYALTTICGLMIFSGFVIPVKVMLDDYFRDKQKQKTS